MKFQKPFSPELTRLIVEKAKRPELLEGFEIADDVLERHRQTVAHHHREKSPAEREAIAVYHALFDPTAPHSILARRKHEHDRGAAIVQAIEEQGDQSRTVATEAREAIIGTLIGLEKARAPWDIAKVIILAAILILLCAGKAHCQGQSVLVLQGQNAGSTLFTRTGGLLQMNCAGTLGCSWSGNTFTLTGGGAGGTMTNPMTTQYDIVYAGNTATPATPVRLGIGSNGNALGASSGVLGYYTIPTLLGFTPIQLSSLSGTSPISYNSSTGAISCATCATAGFANPMTTLGDLISGGASGTPARLAGDTSNTRKFLRSLSTAGTAGAPAWDTLASGDIPNNAANTSGNAGTATALASAPTQCGASNWSTGVAASGNANCSQPAFSNLSGSATTGQLPGTGATTANGQTCTLGSTCNVNAGAAAHSVALNQGAGAAMTGVGPGTTGQILRATTSADPTYIDFPDVHIIPAANCSNTTAGAGWSIGSGGSVSCRAGTNNLGGYVSITDTSSTFAQFTLAIPEDWDTSSNPYIRFQVSSGDSTTGHTIIPQIKVSCAKGDGTTTDDVTFNAAHSLSTVTLNTTANQFWSSANVQMNSTDMTGCVAGALMIVQVGRATDTATGANFYSATLTFPRLLAVQAN